MLLVFGNVKATHIAGMSLTYSPISDSAYRITLMVFRDCSGSNITQAAFNVNWKSACANFNGTIVCTRTPSFNGAANGSAALLPDCKDNLQSRTTCSNPPGTDYGLERYNYEGIFIVPTALRNNPALKNCRLFKFESPVLFQRNPSVTIVATTSYVESWLNDTLQRKNSNVAPTRFSIPAYCSGQPISINLGFVDPDHDSVSTYLVRAKVGAGNFANYNPPFTYLAPVSLPQFDTVTVANGIMTLKPTQIQTGVFAFIAEDWRIIGYDITGQPIHVLAGTSNIDMNFRFDNRSSYCDRVLPRMLNNGLTNPVLVNCKTDTIRVNFSSSIRCSSLSPDGSEFRLMDPNGRIVSLRTAYPLNCTSNGGSPAIMLSKEVNLVFDRAFVTNGIYTLYTKKGRDGNTFMNRCGYFSDEMDSMKLLVTTCYEYKEPLKITNVTVDPANNKDIVITWADPSNAFDYSLFKNFNIYKKVGASSAWSLVYKDPVPSNRTWRDVDFQVNTTICYYAVSVELTNGNQTPIADSITNIVLKSAPNGREDLTASLNWNPYIGWNSPIYNLEYTIVGNQNWSPFLPAPTTSATNANVLLPVISGKYAARTFTENPASPGVKSYSNVLFFDVPTRDLLPFTLVTPNGDGINDVFELEGITFWPNTQVSIYNRWGQKVFTSSNYKNSWGAGANEGTYYYLVVDRDGKQRSGTLKVVK